ncbi:MAG TPA: DUF3043 domain-containing protein [Dermatophilaceae bacterium]|nr:DUF3043 domain-containing protein [Dermatophilaceae bacterium]
MFGRTKTTDEELAAAALHPAREGAKNRPTPKRRDQEAARKQPLVVSDRKRAKELDRQRRRQELAKQRQAMLTGDESNLPSRDRGPVRRYLRDYVDARWSLGEFMLPAMVLVLALSFVRLPWAMLLVFVIVYGLIIFAVLDAVLMWRRVKKQVVTKYGAAAVPSGSAVYAVMRVFQMRRLRMPRPVVPRGQYPS